MPKILIIGNKGNMGRRYELICKLNGCQVDGWDIDGFPPKPGINLIYDGIIIATPTDTHYEIIKFIGGGKPILCEKPITKSKDEMAEIMAIPGLNLRMINQYEFYLNKHHSDPVKLKEHTPMSKKSWYNYFKHGNDGMPWDMINIIGLAQGEFEIGEERLIWDVGLNGKRLNISEMDHAYLWNIADWLQKFDKNHNYIMHAHRKCWEYLDGNN